MYFPVWCVESVFGRSENLYSGMAEDTSWAEATLNSEKIKPVALAIVELRESEGIGQAGRQLIS